MSWQLVATLPDGSTRSSSLPTELKNCVPAPMCMFLYSLCTQSVERVTYDTAVMVELLYPLVSLCNVTQSVDVFS